MDLLKDIVLKFPDILLNRDFIIDAFSVSEHQTLDEVTASEHSYMGKIYRDGSKVMVLLGDVSEEIEVGAQPYLSFSDKVSLPGGTLANASSDIKTTLGKILLNHALLCIPFGDKLPFVNDKWNSKQLEQEIVALMIDEKISVEQGYSYIDHTYFLETYADFCVPSITEKAITISPAILKRRTELLKEHKDELDDPIVMMAIEDELIAMDRKDLQGDTSEGFLIADKNFTDHRKRMFIGIGMVSKFGEKNGGYTFVASNLDEGWKVDDLPALANEIRRGSYMRGKETAKGGTIAKTIGRTFQEAAIVMDNCRTKRTLKIAINDTNKDDYVNRNIITNGKMIELTQDTIGKYIGKTVEMRSPMLCSAKKGYCYACVDTRFKKLGTTLINVQVMGIGSKLMLDSMKAMHVTKVSAYTLESFDEFVV